MDSVDLNLLTALDVLLTEGSVTGAARRLGLSSSAMSRTLTRLRASTGDLLLVRAGCGLVPTPHAAALRDRVHSPTNEVRTVLRPTKTHFGRGCARFDIHHPRGGVVYGNAFQCCDCGHHQSRAARAHSIRAETRHGFTSA
jgi:DNA-binding transcriptional LysR family regulator